MSVAYKVLYQVGFTPWEEIAKLPAVTERFSGLLDREEEGRGPPYGQVLDLPSARVLRPRERRADHGRGGCRRAGLSSTQATGPGRYLE